MFTALNSSLQLCIISTQSRTHRGSKLGSTTAHAITAGFCLIMPYSIRASVVGEYSAS